MEPEYVDYNSLAALLAPQSMALQAIAMRPQKTSATTTTTSTSTPRALNDLIKTRDTIGGATTDLASALRGRENWGYALGNILSNIQADSTPGGWLAGLARGAGAGLTTMENLRQDTAKQLYDARMQDLAQRLAYDKAMGETQTQTQRQEIGYTPMEYGRASTGAKSREEKATGDSFAGIQVGNFGRSVGYDPVENLPNFGPITRAAISEEQLSPVAKYIPGSQTVAKGLAGPLAPQLQSTWSDISDNILSGRVLDFVGKAGGIRVADTPAEQEFIFGPIRNYQSMSKEQLAAGLKQARNNFVASGLKKAKDAGIEVSEDELKNWWNSAFSVPQGMETKTMYNITNKPQATQASSDRKNLIVGEVRNGIRFLGYEPDGKPRFERVQ